MLIGLLIALSAPVSALAKDPKWPTIREMRAGDIFKYPILGIPGAEVRPTQEAVGFRAVAEKLKKMKEMDSDELKDALKDDPIPLVAGPDGNLYMIDHHHQALAAHNAGRENAYFVLHEDYSKLQNMDEFWLQMKRQKWVREFDHLGRPIPIPEGLPRSILGVMDDPYRSLAWYVRKAGGYRKSSIEFAEFLWADFFRSRIKLGTSKGEFKSAVKAAEVMAHTDAAKALPGWNRKSLECSDLFSR